MARSAAPAQPVEPTALALDQVGVGLMVVTVRAANDFIVHDLNWRARELLGVGPEAPSRTVQDALPPELGPRVLDGLRACATSRRDQELELQRSMDGSPQWLHAILTPQLDAAGSVAGITLTLVDRTRQKVAESLTLEGQLRFRTLVEGSSQGLLVLRDDRALFCNDALVKLIGYTQPAELYRLRSLISLVHEDDRTGLLEGLEALRLGSESRRYGPVRARRADGREIWVELFASSVLWEDAPALQVAVHDVTERVQAEHAREESEGRYRTLLERSQQGMVVHVAGKRVFANDALARFYGYADAQEYLSETPGKRFAHVAPEDLARVSAMVDRLLKGEVELLDSEVAILGRDGRRQYAGWQAQLVQWGGEKGILFTLVDITDRRRAEAELSQSEEWYRSVVESSLQGVVVHCEGERVYANDAMARFYGYANAEEYLRLVPRQREGYLATEDLPRIADLVDKLQKHEIDLIETDIALLRRDGTQFHVECQGRRVLWSGKPALMFTFIDISERHRVNSALTESEEHYRSIVESTLQGVMVHQDGSPVFVNQAAARMLGYESPEAHIKSAKGRVFPNVHPDFRNRALEFRDQLLSGATKLVEGDLAFVRQDGRICYAQTHVRRVTWQGRPALLSTLVDVTQRREAENALAESEERYRTIVESGLQAVMVHVDGLPVWANATAARMVRAESPEALIAASQERPLQNVHPSERLRLLAQLAEMNRGQREALNTDVTIVRMDGSTAYTQASARRISWQGKPATLATLVDVTERRVAELALEESESRYRTLIESAPIGIMVHQDARGVFCNSYMARVLGYERAEDYVAAAAEREPMAHVPEFRRQDVVELYLAIQSGAVELDQDQSELHRANAASITVQTDARRILWNGRSAVITTFLDITEHKRLEQELRDSRSMLQAIFDALPVWVVVKDRQSNFLLANQQLIEDMQLDPERIQEYSTRVNPWLTEERRAQTLALDRQVIESGRRLDSPEVLTTLAGGRSVMVRDHRVPLFAEDGTVRGIVVVGHNVTDYVNAQRALQESRALLQSIFDAMPLGIVVKDRQQRFIMVNPQQQRAIAFPMERLGTFRNEDIYWQTPEMKAQTIEEDIHVLETGERLDQSAHPVTLHDGRTLQITTIKVPVRGPDGQVQALVVVNQNVTELMKAQEEIRRRQAMLEAVFDAMPVWVTVKDPQGRYLLVSRMFGEAAGFPMERLGQLTDAELGWARPEHIERLLELDQQVLESGQRYEAPATRISYSVTGRQDRDHEWWHVIKAPVPDQRGEPFALVSISMDVTESMDAAETLRASEERYRALVDGSVQAIGVYSLQDHRALFVNEAMVALAGAKDEATYLRTVRLLDNIREPYLGTARANIERMVAGEIDAFGDEMVSHRADQEAYWTEFIARRVLWNGEPAVQITAMDVSDRKRAEEALKDRQAVLAKQNEYYRQDLSRRRGRPDQEFIISESPAMRRVLHEAEMVSRSRVPVLIEGETGVGKEVVAEFIHRHSDRADHLLSVVNCGALSENLMDAELFGHEKGAFTGATDARAGLIEIADKGTLFLDEIGDLPASAQVRLLRFLERGVMRRVGSNRERNVDVRILAATHKTLKEQVQNGTFREDLYHRLLVIRIEVPPLRSRVEDILPLASRFCAVACQEAHLTPLEFSETARLAMTRYAWPGNVRELAHTVQRAVFAAQLDGAAMLQPQHLDLPLPGPAEAELLPIKEVLRRAERAHVQSVLRRFEGNRRKAAETLGISERHLYRLLN